MRTLFFTTLAIGLLSLAGNSQSLSTSVTPSITNAGGGSWSNSYSYIRYFDWSIGELTLVNTVSSQDGSVTVYQGVLQPCTEKPGFTEVGEDFTPEEVKLMPNPTTGQFELNFFVRENGIMTLELVDIMGKVMQRRSFRYNGNFRTEQYDITHLPSGLYMLVATLTPDPTTNLNYRQKTRHSGIKVIKLR